MLLTTEHETFLAILVLTILLDAVMGDPRILPHPVRVMGKCINIFEQFARRIGNGAIFERTAGIVLAIVITGSTFCLSYLLQELILYRSSGLLKIAGIAFLVYLGSTTLALTELIKEGSGVIKAVSANDIELARKRVSMIVGRDVDHLDGNGVLRATIETLSENLSDGVIAPLFYLALGGVPCALAYKAVNTLDSMVGNLSERYRYFGWASARFDDILNYIPSKISALLIVFASFMLSGSVTKASVSLSTMFNDGKKHASPNSGYPEAAAAGALGVKLGGPYKIRGIVKQKPFIGRGDSRDYLKASYETLLIVRLASWTGYLIAIFAALFLVVR